MGKEVKYWSRMGSTNEELDSIQLGEDTSD